MVEPSSGGRACRDHGTRVIEPVETQWPVEPAETERGGRACRDHGASAGLRPDERAGTPARSFLARPPDPAQPHPLVRAAPDSRDVRTPGGRAGRDHRASWVVETVDTPVEAVRGGPIWSTPGR